MTILIYSFIIWKLWFYNIFKLLRNSKLYNIFKLLFFRSLLDSFIAYFSFLPYCKVFMLTVPQEKERNKALHYQATLSTNSIKGNIKIKTQMQIYFAAILHNYQWMQRGESFSDIHQAVKKLSSVWKLHFIMYYIWCVVGRVNCKSRAKVQVLQ